MEILLIYYNRILLSCGCLCSVSFTRAEVDWSMIFNFSFNKIERSKIEKIKSFGHLPNYFRKTCFSEREFL